MIQAAYRYNAVITEVHDGDTVKLDIDLGLHDHAHWWIRVKDLWCAELGTPDGDTAATFVKDLVFGVHQPLVVVETEKVKSKDPDAVDAMSFQRFVGDIWFKDTGTRLADEVVAAGHGTATRT